ncbi:MAG TPA: tyrosine-type recombinase/integrase [Methanosarcina sp.]|nr:tyrosine-type recombinase/integrase [Methanosarcina sp.]
MKINELRQEPRIQQWLECVNGTKTTERNYLMGLQIFTDWCEKSPIELIEEARKEARQLDMIDRNIKRVLPSFRKSLQDKGLAPFTVKSYMTAVMSFYTYAEIQIPKMSRHGNKARTKKEHKDIPTKEDLQEVLKICDPLEKAVLLVGVSAGLSMNEVVNLTVGDFKDGYDSVSEITTLKLRREKVQFDFITFCTPECSRAIVEYLEYRNRETKITRPDRARQLEKQRIFSDNNYLFIQRRIADEYLDTKDESLRKFTSNGFINLYRTLGEKSRKNTPKGVWAKVRSHNMRHYFNSALLNAGADFQKVQFFMGHSIDNASAAYFHSSPEMLRDIYARFVPYLTIQKDTDVSESPEYLKVKQENQILQAETARHIVERSELQELRNQLYEVRKAQQEKEAAEKTFQRAADTVDFNDAEVQAQLMLFLVKNLQRKP